MLRGKVDGVRNFNFYAKERWLLKRLQGCEKRETKIYYFEQVEEVLIWNLKLTCTERKFLEYFIHKNIFICMNFLGV